MANGNRFSISELGRSRGTGAVCVGNEVEPVTAVITDPGEIIEFLPVPGGASLLVTNVAFSAWEFVPLLVEAALGADGEGLREGLPEALLKLIPLPTKRAHPDSANLAGTGVDVAMAIDRGAETVVAVEAHKPLVELLRTAAPTRISQIFNNPRVTWQTLVSRTWLARDQQQYDLIILPKVGGFGGKAVALARGEVLGRQCRALCPARATLANPRSIAAGLEQAQPSRAADRNELG